MINWPFLNDHRVTNGNTGIPEHYWSDASDGFNGMFRFWIKDKKIRCIASDGEGWRHVSVSIEGEKKTPSWEMMCLVKDLFWDDEDVVVQFHPKKSEYVNHHPGCLHLWQPFIKGQVLSFPTPKSILVGPKP